MANKTTEIVTWLLAGLVVGVLAYHFLAERTATPPAPVEQLAPANPPISDYCKQALAEWTPSSDATAINLCASEMLQWYETHPNRMKSP